MKRILVADDDPGMARTVCDILRRRGESAQAAESWEAALKADNGRDPVRLRALGGW